MEKLEKKELSCHQVSIEFEACQHRTPSEISSVLMGLDFGNVRESAGGQKEVKQSLGAL